MSNPIPPVLSIAVSRSTPLATTDARDGKATDLTDPSIAAVEAEVRERKRARLQATNDENDALTSRFPLEICSEIFCWCLPTPKWARLDHCTPLLLSSVSRSWRQLAHSTPHLWTTMSMRSTLGRDDERSWVRQSLALEWLDRSRELPLTIFLDITPGASIQCQPKRYLFKPLIHKINQESHRLASLWITAPAPHIGWIDFQDRGSQQLFELGVISHDPEVDHADFASCAPKLLELGFNPMSSWTEYPSFLKFGVLTSNLTEVRLASVKWTDLMTILQNSPLLRVCLIQRKLKGAGPWDPLDDDPNIVKPPPVTLNNLETLHITEQHSTSPFTILMELLILPSLTEFKLQAEDRFFCGDAPPILEQLQANLERSSSRLSALFLLDLRFGNVLWDEDDDYNVYRGIQYSSLSNLVRFLAPTIRSLTIESSSQSEFRPGAFMQSIVNCSANFPMLHSIQVCCPPPWWLHTLLELRLASEALYEKTDRSIPLSLFEHKGSAWWNYALSRLLGLPCEDPDKFNGDEDWIGPLPIPEPKLPPISNRDILQFLSSMTGNSPRITIAVPVDEKGHSSNFWPLIEEALVKYERLKGRRVRQRH